MVAQFYNGTCDAAIGAGTTNTCAKHVHIQSMLNGAVITDVMICTCFSHSVCIPHTLVVQRREGFGALHPTTCTHAPMTPQPHTPIPQSTHSPPPNPTSSNPALEGKWYPIKTRASSTPHPSPASAHGSLLKTPIAPMGACTHSQGATRGPLRVALYGTLSGWCRLTNQQGCMNWTRAWRWRWGQGRWWCCMASWCIGVVKTPRMCHGTRTVCTLWMVLLHTLQIIGMFRGWVNVTVCSWW